MALPVRSSVRFVLALAVGAPALVRAEAPAKLSIAAAGECPSEAEITRELRELMPETQFAPSPTVDVGDIVVSDAGPDFSVDVRGQRRRFRDPKRDCTERARHVAVFTVLIVDPLHVATRASALGETPEPRQNAASPPAAAPSGPPPPVTLAPHPPLDLSLGPVVQVALDGDADHTTQAGGIGLRARYGERVGITLGAAGLLPTSLRYELAQARATWIPIDLGLALSERLQAWEVSLEVGLAGALLLVEGQALDATRQATRLELGGRVGGQVRYWASPHAGIGAGVFGSYFPKPYSLQVEGLGAVGQTPSAWVGGALGAVIRL